MGGIGTCEMDRAIAGYFAGHHCFWKPLARSTHYLGQSTQDCS